MVENEGFHSGQSLKAMRQTVRKNNHCDHVTAAVSLLVRSRFLLNTQVSLAEINRLGANRNRSCSVPNGTVFPPGVDSIWSGHHLMVVTQFNLNMQTPKTKTHVECLPS